MALKTYNPTSPGQRHVVLVDRNHLWKGAPVKLLTEGLIKTGGRGNLGRITSRRKGGGHKRAYRLVDFKRDKFDVPATVERLEYDPNRTAYILSSSIRTVSRPIFWHRRGSQSATPSCPDVRST